MNNYPYPVLTNDQSAYKNSRFEIICSDCQVKDGIVMISLSVELSSAFLSGLLEDGKAKAIVKINSDIFTKSSDITINQEKTNIQIACERFKTNDIISVTAFIVANDSFTYLWNDEIMDFYPQEMAISIRKYDVLAISNTEKFDYTVVNTDFIKISCSDEQEGKGISIKLTNDNFIEILVGTSLNHAYAATKSDPKISPIIGSHLVFEAFVLVLIEIIQGKDRYTEKEWYRLFSNLLQATTGDEVDDMVKKVKDDYIDMNQVFGYANSLTNNQIEQSLIKASEEVGR